MNSEELKNKPKPNKTKKKKGMKIRTKIILIIILIILIAIGSVFIYANYEADRMLSNIETGEVIDTNEADIAEEVIETVKERHVLNIALFGCDNEASSNTSFQEARSDAMKVISLDYDNKKIKISNLERDVVVYGPGDYQNYLHFNWAYWFGGPTLAVQTINYNLDLDITKYVTVSFAGLKNIVDLLGGVDIELTPAEGWRMGLPSGVNCLNGDNALLYARIRELDSDFVRVNRQNNVIKAVLKKVSTLSLTEIYSVANEALQYISTNLTSNEIKNYILDLLKFDLKDIETNTEPNGEYNDICTCPGLGGYLVRSYTGMAEHLHGFIYGEDFPYTPSSIVVQNEKNIYERYGNFSKE